MVRVWLAAPGILALLTLALPAQAGKGLFEGGGPLDFITKPLAQVLGPNKKVKAEQALAVKQEEEMVRKLEDELKHRLEELRKEVKAEEELKAALVIRAEHERAEEKIKAEKEKAEMEIETEKKKAEAEIMKEKKKAKIAAARLEAERLKAAKEELKAFQEAEDSPEDDDDLAVLEDNGDADIEFLTAFSKVEQEESSESQVEEELKAILEKKEREKEEQLRMEEVERLEMERWMEDRRDEERMILESKMEEEMKPKRGKLNIKRFVDLPRNVVKQILLFPIIEPPVKVGARSAMDVAESIISASTIISKCLNTFSMGLDMVDNVMQFTGLDRSQPGMDVIAALSQIDKALGSVQELVDFFVA